MRRENGRHSCIKGSKVYTNETIKNIFPVCDSVPLSRKEYEDRKKHHDVEENDEEKETSYNFGHSRMKSRSHVAHRWRNVNTRQKRDEKKRTKRSNDASLFKILTE